MQNRSIRLFLSSTFRDFGEERDLLVKRVFPALRARLKDRFVELVDVDLRWGITVEEAERGDVLPICLAEIDRARPYFIGMLGERYGWIPSPESFAPDLIERQPWLKKHLGGKSVTELEILHGVLNNRRMKGRAFFYFRSSGYAKAKGGDYAPASPEDSDRQRDLKRRIRADGYPVTAYRDPHDLAKRLERDLWKMLDAEFPAASVPDAFERESIRHEAYATPRRLLYLGGERYQAQLASAIDSGEQRIVVEGASGGGKSALLANFFEGYRKRNPRHRVHEHYLGASADAGDPQVLVRRLCEFIKRQTASTQEIESDSQKLMDSLPLWLATASSWASKRKARFICVVDSLNSLTDQQDLRWWPAYLPQDVHFVISCLPGLVLQALKAKSDGQEGQSPRWKTINVKPLTKTERKNLLVTYLARFNKTLRKELTDQVIAHPQSGSPLFIRTLAEELRLFGVHEQLTNRLSHYLKSQTIDDLFERVIERVEGDCGKKAVKASLTAIWASRAGLTEKEILDIVGLKPAEWAPIRNALDEALLEAYGRITFAHDYLRIAVRDRYLSSLAERNKIHRRVGLWFSKQIASARRVEEEPYQWIQAKSWRKLSQCLTEETLISHFLEVNDGYDLIKYWLAIPGMHFSSLEDVYRKAWSKWDSLSDWGEISQLAFRLSHFLSSKGLNGDFVLRLAQLALDLDRRNSDGAPLYGPALSLVGQVCFSRGDLKTARAHFEQAVQMTTETNCAADELAIRKYNLARVMLAEDQIKNGRLLQEEALHEALEAWGAHSPALLPFLHGLGKVYDEQGLTDDALRLVRQAYLLEQKLYGTNDVRAATSLNNLGWLESKNGSYERASSLFRRCIELRTKAYGPDHIELNIPMANLAHALSHSAQYEEAIPVAEESVRQALMRYGQASSELAGRIGILATILQKSGKIEKAEEQFRAAVQAASKYTIQSGRQGSLALATSLSNLGLFLFETGRAKEAEKPMRSALAMQEEISGKHSKNWAIPAFNLALILKSLGGSKTEGEVLQAQAEQALNSPPLSG